MYHSVPLSGYSHPRKRIARRMDYHLLPAPPGAPCPRDALRVCRLLKLDDALMDLFQADL